MLTWLILGIAIGAFLGSLATAFFLALVTASRRVELDGAIDRFADYAERLARSKDSEQRGEAVHHAID